VKSGRRGWIRILLWLLVLVVATGAAGGGLLYRSLVSKFEGARWRLPSRVYSDSLTLYPGLDIARAGLIERLDRLGYRAVARRPNSPGAFQRTGEALEIYLRDFAFPSGHVDARLIRIRLDGGDIGEIRDLDSDEEVFTLEIEPELIAGLFSEIWEERTPVSMEDVPPHLVHAVVAIEDHRFFRHHGVDFIGVARALWVNISAGRVLQGGSTITQQLVKNFYLTAEQSLWRKIVEAVMALILEATYSKREILECYLNEIYLGQRGAQGIYGIGEAARFYFGKPVQRLELHETALLAALIRSPGGYSPHRNVARIRERRDIVLDRMLASGSVSAGEAAEAGARPVEVGAFVPQHNEAPYFVDFLTGDLKDHFPATALTSQGMRIFTTLDLHVQQAAERSIVQGLERLERSYPALRPDPDGRPLEGCLVALQPQTGHVLAMVGGRDYRASKFNRVTQALRQPGSVFKPFVFCAALQAPGPGAQAPFTPATLIDDAPITVPDHSGPWSPRNYDGRYRGKVTVRRALEESLNVPTVRLALEVGLDRIAETARDFGLSRTSLVVPSLALGSVEVTPLEMASAYSVFANGGLHASPIAVKKVVDRYGNVLERRSMKVKRVTSPQVAHLITRLLEGAVERGTGRGLARYGLVGGVAGKTGTTSDYQDAWFVGYTSDLLALVWIGFDRGGSLGITGAQGALPIWADFAVTSGQAAGRNDFFSPPGLVEAAICRESGEMAASGCPARLTETFLAGTAPELPCTLHGRVGPLTERGDAGSGEEETQLESGGEESSLLEKIKGWFKRR